MPSPISFHFPRHLAHSARPLHCICANKLRTGNLHLLLRLVIDGLLLSELQRARSPHTHHIAPTHRGVCRLHSTPPASFHTSSATLTPPRAPMRGQPWHNSIPALRLTISVCQSGLRRTASRGREIIADALCHALANKLPVAPLHCTTPRFAVHSDLLTFLQPQSPPLRTAPSLPHIATFNPFD